MKKTTLLSILLVVLFALPLLGAQENEASASSEVVLQISSLPEAKLLFTQSFKFPFLAGSGALTKGNNINFALTGEATPITLGGLFEVTWTPIAFIQIVAGGRVGSGWRIKLGGYVNGIGINNEDGLNNSEWVGSAFDGVLWGVHWGGTFQFDFGAIFPSDWTHVVFRTYHEINYAGNTAAAQGESWYFESDAGENINGFNYYGNFLVGYQMPIFLDTVGILTEMELYLYDTPGRAQWGDDLIRWKFGLLTHFTLSKDKKWGAALLVQFRTMRNFTNYTPKPKRDDHLYYRQRLLDTNNKLRLEFYRVAAVFSYKF